MAYFNKALSYTRDNLSRCSKFFFFNSPNPLNASIALI